MKETAFGNKFLEELGKVCKLWKLKVVGHDMQQTSIPDWLLCINGKFVAIEFKIQRKNKIIIEPRQAKELNDIANNSGIALLIAFDEDKQEILINVSILPVVMAREMKLDWDYVFNSYEFAVQFVDKRINLERRLYG